MANRHRGEISAMLDGHEWILCLTLGTLAELETAFEASDMGALLKRFSGSTLSAHDAARVIAAGLKGGGNPVPLEQVAQMRADGGATGFARIVNELLTATFGESKPEQSAANP
ncbi:gene transfer agent family protein [Phyllobacterium sp. 628]|nr:gene transfer agent family protein [Phyllobacterium sp. 628]